MADCVLDTHALLWALARPDKLGKGARRVVDAAGAGRSTAFVPAIVLIEIALLEATGRRTLSLADVRDAIEQSRGLEVLPLDDADAVAFQALPITLEAFDRLVVAAASARALPLVTADEAIQELRAVRCIWD